MALRGVWQLQKLLVSYCDWGGSSRGIRFEDSFGQPPLLSPPAGWIPQGWNPQPGVNEDLKTALGSRHCCLLQRGGFPRGGIPNPFSWDRAFMESHLPAFKEHNPQLEVVTELIRGQHPHLKGFYKNHNQRVICVKNLAPEDILLHATRLRNALGRKVVKLRTRHVTKHPSVQGTGGYTLRRLLGALAVNTPLNVGSVLRCNNNRHWEAKRFPALPGQEVPNTGCDGPRCSDPLIQ
ncbi:hypothetical protein Taro_008922 [Colocasia esculenta]|uniref:Large ribosomal subunit protein mL43 n=1 Tax=Colocasia esculenta TaxID=4460 RepID=A0A843U3M8_COLES|nr:hypothetical protein [Colocasia esculenta]